MIRRILMALLVGAAIVAIDRPDDAAKVRDAAERAIDVCTDRPDLCRAAAEGVLGEGVAGERMTRGE